VRSKLCTPKFFKNAPPHPGQKPKESNSTSDALRQWNKKSKKFAQFYLTLFRPEPNLYKNKQPNTYSYEWKDLVKFVEELNELRGKKNDIAIRRFHLDYIVNMIHCLKTLS